MASVSDRSIFLETIKTKPLTITQIVETFGCSEGTARNWVKHKEVERVEGSWPPKFVRKNSIATDLPVKEVKAIKNNKSTVELPNVPTEVKERMFRAVLADEPDGRFNFTQDFRIVDDLEGLQNIRIKLVTGLVLVEYYEKLMKDEGID